jgi:hypothetical protein
MAELRRGFWTRETGTGQQVAQLHERLMMMMMMMMMKYYTRLLQTSCSVLNAQLFFHPQLLLICRNYNKIGKVRIT